MATGPTLFGDMSPRTAAFASVEMLTRGQPFLILEKFAQHKVLGKNKTLTMSFRRFKSLDPTPKPLSEGVTPAATKMTHEDVEVSLTQYGDRITVSDVVADTHEDPVLKEATAILGEQAAQMVELIRFGVLKGCTNVFYAGSEDKRSDVVETFTKDMQRKITLALKKQNARPITSVIKSTPSYGTEQVAPAFIAIIPVDLEPVVEKFDGFTPVEKYGAVSPYEAEIGKVGNVRYLASNLLESYKDAGGAKAGSGVEMVSESGTNADIFPVIFLGRDAWATVALKGENAITPTMVRANPSDSDPLGQRNHVGWKTMTAAVILNDLYMAVAEVACPA